MSKDPKRDIWYFPSLNWKHWSLILALVGISILQGYVVTIPAIIGRTIGTIVLVYILLILYNGTRKMRGADETIHEEWAE